MSSPATVNPALRAPGRCRPPRPFGLLALVLLLSLAPAIPTDSQARDTPAADPSAFLVKTAGPAEVRPERRERETRGARTEGRAREELRTRLGERLNHVESRHVGKSPDYLRDRVTGKNGLERASTFKDHESLLRGINAVESDPRNREVLNEWAKNDAARDKLTLQREVRSESLGTVVERRADGTLKTLPSGVVQVRYTKPEKTRAGTSKSYEIDTVMLDSQARTDAELRGPRPGE